MSRGFALFVLLVACEHADAPAPDPRPTPIELPSPTPDPLRDGEAVPIVAIRLANNEVYVSGLRVFHTSEPELALTQRPQIADAITKALPAPTPESRVIITSRREVLHGVVVATMEAAKTAGFSHIALAVERP